MPKQGGALLLGNHISWIDWAIVELASPRPVHFVIDRAFYDNRFLSGFLKMFGAIPISPRGSKQALATIRQLLLDGEVVCLFPEGGISRDGQLSEFKAGFQRSVQDTGVPIVPFYMHGLWGSAFSRAGGKASLSKVMAKLFHRRRLVVRFGEALADSASVATVKSAVQRLRESG